MKRTDQGSFVVSATEMHVLRQALFVTLHHGDVEVQQALHTITGYDRDEFEQLIWAVDELNGHNEEVRRLLERQLDELTALPPPELARVSRRIHEVVDAADRYGVDVPPNLRSAGHGRRG